MGWLLLFMVAWAVLATLLGFAVGRALSLGRAARDEGES